MLRELSARRRVRRADRFKAERDSRGRPHRSAGPHSVLESRVGQLEQDVQDRDTEIAGLKGKPRKREGKKRRAEGVINRSKEEVKRLKKQLHENGIEFGEGDA